MIFNTAAKAQLVALVESLEPTPEVNPLQEQLDAALAANQDLTDELAIANAKLTAARTAAAATVDALA